MRTRRVAALLVLAACSGTPGPVQRVPSGGASPASPRAGGSGGAVGGAPLAAAGSGDAGAAGALPDGVTAVKVTLADVGLEASSLDRTADPCVDFYQFACGGWLQNHPIPPERPGWSRYAEVREKTLAELQAILEDAAKGIGADADTRRLGDFYASCMDEAAIEKAGAAALGPLVERVARVKDARSWLAALAELHRLGRWAVWRVRVAPDLKDATTYAVYLDAAGLGLPDRDYYTRPERRPQLDAYRAHVARTLALAGTPSARAEAAAADVVAIEAELARLAGPRAAERELAASYNPIDAAALARQARSIDWRAYWKALGVEPPKKLVLSAPPLFAQLDRLRTAFGGPQWASYFTYHLVHGVALALPRALDEEAFALEQILRGTERREGRARRCIAATGDALGDLLGARYVEAHLAPGARQAAGRLADAVADAMATELGQLDWMSDATRRAAQAKLARMERRIGHPDRWLANDLDVRRDDLLGNTLRAAAQDARRRLQRAGRPVDRGQWQLAAYAADAWYHPAANSVELPAGLLQPPFFGADRAIAANLGGLGVMIGHELVHGFDDQGAQLDGAGNLASWWAPEDTRRFAGRAACVAELYSTFEAAPGAFVNGRLTLGEDLADLGGAKLAFAAYRALRRDAAKVYVADGFTEDQQFFLGVGQAWCGRDRPAEVARRLLADEHAPAKLRVYGALRNLGAFAEAFRCAPGTPMRPAQTCSVW